MGDLRLPLSRVVLRSSQIIPDRLFQADSPNYRRQACNFSSTSSTHSRALAKNGIRIEAAVICSPLQSTAEALPKLAPNIQQIPHGHNYDTVLDLCSMCIYDCGALVSRTWSEANLAAKLKYSFHGITDTELRMARCRVPACSCNKMMSFFHTSAERTMPPPQIHSFHAETQPGAWGLGAALWRCAREVATPAAQKSRCTSLL